MKTQFIEISKKDYLLFQSWNLGSPRKAYAAYANEKRSNRYSACECVLMPVPYRLAGRNLKKSKAYWSAYITAVLAALRAKLSGEITIPATIHEV
jgi:hypothetical protein